MARGFGRKDEGNTAVLDGPEAEVDTPTEDSEQEDTNTPVASTEAETPNLNDFWTAVDASNGEDFSAVIAEYGKLSRGGKLLAKNGIKTRAMAAIEQDDYAKAKTLG